MMIGSYGWHCPVCGKQGAIIGGAKPNHNVVWFTSIGSGTSVCTACGENKRDEIEKHNRIYYNNIKNTKDDSCEHEWLHPAFGRWVCAKCGAEFNWFCGCGGSGYVCQKHYDEFIEKHAYDLNGFLSKNSW